MAASTGRFPYTKIIHAVIWLAIAWFGSAASAAILGDLTVGSAGTMTVTLTSFSFGPDPSSTPPGPPWNAEVAAGTSLTFAGCASGVLGSAGCLSATEAIQIFSPLTSSTPVPVTSYLTFAAHPSLVYSLNSVGPGSSNTNCAAAVAVGDACSPGPGSPLLLTRSATGTTITFAVAGKASAAGPAGLASGSDYVGQFTAMVAGQSLQQVQVVLAAGGSVTTSQSGEFVITAVP